MVVPVVGEPFWLPALHSLPPWTPEARRIVVLAPHPDDETLGAGGLIARSVAAGVSVEVIAATDGEHAYTMNTGLAETRIAEQTAALGVLGVPPASIYRLHLPDSGLAGHEEAIQIACARLIDAETLVLAPWTGDFHPDHEACGRAALAAARQSASQLAFYLFWTWHRGTPESLRGETLLRYDLSPEVVQRKLLALDCHRSQLHNDAEGAILPEDLLGPARRPFEVFLPA